MRRQGLLGASLLALAIALTLALPCMAAAEELPTRKAGLWEMKMAAGPLPAVSMQQCSDESTDRQMSTTFGPMQKDMCPRKDIQKTANGYSIDSTCNTGPTTLTSHVDITGDFQSAYTMKVTSHAGDGAPAGMPRDTTLTVEAKWLGPCKPDQKPGDMVLGGMKMNIKDLDALRGMTKKP